MTESGCIIYNAVIFFFYIGDELFVNSIRSLYFVFKTLRIVQQFCTVIKAYINYLPLRIYLQVIQTCEELM